MISVKNFYIHHKLSSPYHPESNGLAEAAVKNAQSLLKKCEITGQNFQRSLSVFRNMPRSDGPSPVFPSSTENEYISPSLACDIYK